MNWLQHHPADLVERIEPTEALAQLRQQATLSLEQAATLDIYLHHWTLLVLQRSDDPEGVQEMLTLNEIAQALVPAGAEGLAMQHRWSGFEDLLEGKRRQLQAQEQARQNKLPIQLKQQDNILEILQRADDGRIKQTTLAAQLQLSKGRVSQILGVLESRALITRQREGKESWVRLTQTNATPATPHLGENVFSFHKAA